MRVHIPLLFAAVAITHATKAEPAILVGVTTNKSITESSSTAAREKGDEMTNANVLVKEVVAEEKTRRTIATGSPTKPSEESTYTAGRDDGERMLERLSEMVDKVKDAVSSKVGNKDQFSYKMDKLGKMIMSVKESSSKSVKEPSSKPVEELSSKSVLYAVKRVENGLFLYWNKKAQPLNKAFELLKLNPKMTPAELFGNPSFRWWIDYSDFLFKQVARNKKTGEFLMEVFKFKPSTNLAWLRHAREEESTKELANRVWTNLLREHLHGDTNPEIIETKLMIPPKSFHDDKDLKNYELLYDKREKDAEKKKSDYEVEKMNKKLREEKRKKLNSEETKRLEQEMITKREED
ncbi:unnamed protein product [Peronospora farinosa]|uniref:RxLR effector protein n=1 Tax=Peronospora farinosa TaxID=134698 RepID=A0AAV0USJ0_9STRA|nr:unnamed protein product [Peronospora farinosa]